jgi:hypothetical protein
MNGSACARGLLAVLPPPRMRTIHFFIKIAHLCFVTRIRELTCPVKSARLVREVSIQLSAQKDAGHPRGVRPKPIGTIVADASMSICEG